MTSVTHSNCFLDANAWNGYHLFELFSRRFANNHCILNVQLDCKLSTTPVSFWEVYLLTEGKERSESPGRDDILSTEGGVQFVIETIITFLGNGLQNTFS